MQIRVRPKEQYVGILGVGEPMAGKLIYYSSPVNYFFLDFEQSPIKHKIELRRVRPTHIGWLDTGRFPHGCG